MERTPEELYQFENETRGWMQLFVPLIARYDPVQHLNGTGLLSLLWLSNMERYSELHKSGVEMLAIAYPSWKQNPRQTALSMLEYCNCLPTDLTAIEATHRSRSLRSMTAIVSPALWWYQKYRLMSTFRLRPGTPA